MPRDEPHPENGHGGVATPPADPARMRRSGWARGVLLAHEARVARSLLLPSVVASAVFVYGFIFYTLGVSLTDSRLLPAWDFAGLKSYARLWSLAHWYVALDNLVVFGLLYVGLCVALGFVIAVLLDQNVRGERWFRPIILYPMALSFIVTGTVWKWFLNPGLGLERTVRAAGWEGFTMDWIVNPDRAIYTIVLAGVWQSTGFCMAMFLAGLRSIDREIMRAATIDGATGVTLYRRVVLPMLRPTILSVLVIQIHLTIKAYDLVIALTGGGPGNSTALPATFMYEYTFTRNQMAVGSASAIIMLLMVAGVIVPYLWYELRRHDKGARA